MIKRKLGIDDDIRDAVFNLITLINEVAGNVFVETIKTLRQLHQMDPIEHEFKIKPLKKHIDPAICRIQKDLANGTKTIEDLDITQLWSLLKNYCRLSKINKHWTERGQISIGAELEHFLTKVKSLRNVITHEYRFLLRQSKECLQEKELQLVKALIAIIDTIKLSKKERENWINKLNHDLRSARLTEFATLLPSTGQMAVYLSNITAQGDSTITSYAQCLHDRVDVIGANSKLRPDIEQIFEESKNDDMTNYRIQNYIKEWNATHPPLSEDEVNAEMESCVDFLF